MRIAFDREGHLIMYYNKSSDFSLLGDGNPYEIVERVFDVIVKRELLDKGEYTFEDFISEISNIVREDIYIPEFYKGFYWDIKITPLRNDRLIGVAGLSNGVLCKAHFVLIEDDDMYGWMFDFYDLIPPTNRIM